MQLPLTQMNDTHRKEMDVDGNRWDEPVIQVKDLYKIYRVGEERVRALNGVSFSIRRGCFCSIVGASGSGKSTLLNMLAGLEKPTRGEILIAGEHMERKTENQLVAFRREHIGFIFQSFNLMGTMNAIENVALPLTFQGMDKKSRNKKAEEMLDLVGLTKHKRHRPNQMSGGQQQRVGVARALVVEPEIIFADEPTGNLDSNTSVEVMNLMKRVVREKNQTLVMVTHDNYLAGFADIVIRIRDGKILEIEERSGQDMPEEIEKFAERKDRRDERENEELWENSETFGRRFGGPVFCVVRVRTGGSVGRCGSGFCGGEQG